MLVDSVGACAVMAFILGVIPVVSQGQDLADGGRPPATVEAAAKVLSLATFPLVDGADDLTDRQLARLSYKTQATVQTAFAFQKEQLEAVGFRELPNASVTDQYASSLFIRDGFRVAVTIMPDYSKPGSGKVGITLQNLSNVDLGSLPVPADATPLHDFPASKSWLTDRSPEQAATRVSELFVEQGWEPYGKAGGVQFFRKHAVRVSAQIAAAPAQQGKTVITYTSEQLSTELPAPPDASRVQYSDGTKQLSIDTPATADEVVAYYRDRLSTAGWKATTDRPVVDRFKSFLIFRNPADDLLELTLVDGGEVRRVNIRHQSAAEVEAESLKAQALAAAALAKRDAPNPKVTLKLPVGAKVSEQSPRSVEFTVAANSARTRVVQWGKTLTAAGWKEVTASLDPMAGALTFSKDQATISIDYVDIGFGPADVSVTATLVDLEVTR